MSCFMDEQTIMENRRAAVLLLIVWSHIVTSSISQQVHIVYMGSKVHDDPDVTSLENRQTLAVVHNGSMEKAKFSIVYSYRHGFRGFAAKLTDAQAAAMAKVPGVVSVFPNKRRKLHTTYSWEFLGMANDNSLKIPTDSTKQQEDVIIGVIDTGIWPESPSFSDQLMSPVPPRWKGICQSGEQFPASTCNRKLIGARYYLDGMEAEKEGMMNPDISGEGGIEYRSARDTIGHGSHTASIAAGRHVGNITFNGLAGGSARGGAPFARIAVYKTCWESGCYDSDILAAFDHAIKDGVDILSLSLGSNAPQDDYFSDAISVGSFHATQNGIAVVCSVGNDGSAASATNLAPWIITVAASSMDRDFTSAIKLGNNATYIGESLNMAKMNASTTLLSAADAHAKYFTPYQSSFCLDSSLDNSKVAGKILVCLHPEGSVGTKMATSQIVQAAGGVGMILIDEAAKNLAIPFVIPAAIVGNKAGVQILSYVNSTRFPKAFISPAETIMGSRPAPQIASFSSKGPNALTPDILKPDITAPGLNILAAWTPVKKGMNFNIVSGTSMACPHVTGVVALIKAAHPSWTPSAIKSAIMTTASVLDKDNKLMTAAPQGRTANPFDFGAGLIRPMKVQNPGLVYDADATDYKNFLCGTGYDDDSLRRVTGDESVCPKPPATPSNLNYPSMSVSQFRGNSSIVRTVTNVGQPKSIYKARISPPKGIIVQVVPNVLIFNSTGQKISFTVELKASIQFKGYAFGSLSWVYKNQQIRSPLVVNAVST